MVVYRRAPWTPNRDQICILSPQATWTCETHRKLKDKIVGELSARDAFLGQTLLFFLQYGILTQLGIYVGLELSKLCRRQTPATNLCCFEGQKQVVPELVAGCCRAKLPEESPNVMERRKLPRTVLWNRSIDRGDEKHHNLRLDLHYSRCGWTYGQWWDQAVCQLVPEIPTFRYVLNYFLYHYCHFQVALGGLNYMYTVLYLQYHGPWISYYRIYIYIYIYIFIHIHLRNIGNLWNYTGRP